MVCGLSREVLEQPAKQSRADWAWSVPSRAGPDDLLLVYRSGTASEEGAITDVFRVHTPVERVKDPGWRAEPDWMASIQLVATLRRPLTYSRLKKLGSQGGSKAAQPDWKLARDLQRDSAQLQPEPLAQALHTDPLRIQSSPLGGLWRSNDSAELGLLHPGASGSGSPNSSGTSAAAARAPCQLVRGRACRGRRARRLCLGLRRSPRAKTLRLPTTLEVRPCWGSGRGSRCSISSRNSPWDMTAWPRTSSILRNSVADQGRLLKPGGDGCGRHHRRRALGRFGWPLRQRG